MTHAPLPHESQLPSMPDAFFELYGQAYEQILTDPTSKIVIGDGTPHELSKDLATEAVRSAFSDLSVEPNIAYSGMGSRAETADEDGNFMKPVAALLGGSVMAGTGLSAALYLAIPSYDVASAESLPADVNQSTRQMIIDKVVFEIDPTEVIRDPNIKTYIVPEDTETVAMYGDGKTLIVPDDISVETMHVEGINSSAVIRGNVELAIIEGDDGELRVEGGTVEEGYIFGNSPIMAEDDGGDVKNYDPTR